MISYIQLHRAVGALSSQSKFITIMTIIVPIGLLVSDYSQPSVWHDLWQISTTAIGTLILVIVRQYLSNQKELKQAIQKLQDDRETIIADTRLAYAKELGMQRKRQDRIIEILVQIIFKLFPNGSSGPELQRMVKELMDSGE